MQFDTETFQQPAMTARELPRRSWSYLSVTQGNFRYVSLFRAYDKPTSDTKKPCTDQPIQNWPDGGKNIQKYMQGSSRRTQLRNSWRKRYGKNSIDYATDSKVKLMVYLLMVYPGELVSNPILANVR